MRTWNKSHRRKDQESVADVSGYTLIELMVASLIAAGLLVTIAMTIGNMASSFGETYSEQKVNDSVNAALTLMRRDVERLGTGIPNDLMTQSELTMVFSEGLIHQFYTQTIRDQNFDSQPDVLWLSGAGMDGSPTTEKASYVAAYDPVATPNLVDIVRLDNPSSNNQYIVADPSEMDPVDPSQFPGVPMPIYNISIVHPVEGYRSNVPVPVQLFAGSSDPFGDHSILTATIDSTLLTSNPVPGDSVYFIRPAVQPDGTFSAPSHQHQARWTWVANATDPLIGTLYREVVPDPGLPASANPAQTGTPILNNVVDFQVAFLVWPCNTDQPVWIDHLLDADNATGEFSGNPYRPGSSYSNRADRFMAMRERLIAVRVTMLLREQHPRRNFMDVLFGGGVSGRDIEDRTINTTDMDTDYRHFVVQQVFYPSRFVVSTSTDDPNEKFPKVRSNTTDNAMRNPTGGYCSGRRQT